MDALVIEGALTATNRPKSGHECTPAEVDAMASAEPAPDELAALLQVSTCSTSAGRKPNSSPAPRESLRCWSCWVPRSWAIRASTSPGRTARLPWPG